MFEDMKATLNDWTDEDEISRYLTALLHKEAFDRAGLIYGMGHAVYSLSDPRAQIFRGFVEKLSAEKGCEKEFALYAAVNALRRKSSQGNAKSIRVSARTSISSAAFAYSMLGLPVELYTPIFAIARIVGWSATPSGGSDRRRKNHASCLQKCQRAQTLCANVKRAKKPHTRVSPFANKNVLRPPAFS